MRTRGGLPPRTRIAGALLALLGALATATPAATAATPGEWRLTSPSGPGNHVDLRVGADGRTITATNSFVYDDRAPYCVWGGRLFGGPGPVDPDPRPVASIGADGSFAFQRSDPGPLGVGASTAATVGRFTSPTTAHVSVTLSTCPFQNGPVTVEFDGGLVAGSTPAPVPPPAGGGVPVVPGGGAPAPPGSAGAPGGLPSPGPAATKGCVDKVTTGQVEARSSCFRVAGTRATSTDRVRVNGVDLVPDAGTSISIDTRVGRLTSTGPVRVVVGPLRLARLRPDWDLSRTVVFEIAVDPKDPPKTPEAKADAAPVPAERALGGLRVGGSAKLSWSPGKTSITLGAKLPEQWRFGGAAFEELSGELVVSATNDDGLVLDSAKVEFGLIRWGTAEIRDFSFSFARSDGGASRWEGSLKVYMPALPRFQGFELSGGWGTDGYRRLRGGVDGLNVSLAFGVFLQRVSAELGAKPLTLGGGAGVTWGPQFKFPGEAPVSALSLDAGFRYENTNPDTFTFTGKGAIVGRGSLDGKVVLKSTGTVDVDGTVKLEVPGGRYGFEGSLAGWLQDSQFNLDGDAKLSIPGPDQRGRAVISSAGAAACRSGLVSVGFGYHWGDKLPRAIGGSCGLEEWRRERPQASTAQAGARTSARFTVARGQRTVAFAALGSAGAPQVVLTGPRGFRLTAPAEPEGSAFTARTGVLKDDRQTAFVLARPVPGRYALAVLPGSPPVAEFRSARARPALQLRARVAGTGARRRLIVRADGLDGGRVTFVDEGPTGRQVVLSTRSRRAAARFSPVPSRRAGIHRILAQVEQGGLPLPTRTIARFRAGATPPARAVRRLRIRRTATRAIVTWTGRVGGRYRVTARTSDRRLVLLAVAGRRPQAVIEPLGRRTRLRVTVTELDVLGRPGRPARRTSG